MSWTEGIRWTRKTGQEMITVEAGGWVHGCSLQSFHFHTCLEFSMIKSQWNDLSLAPPPSGAVRLRRKET